MNRINYLESLLEELEELETVEEVKELIQLRLEEAYDLHERKMMISSDSLYNTDDDTDEDF